MKNLTIILVVVAIGALVVAALTASEGEPCIEHPPTEAAQEFEEKRRSELIKTLQKLKKEF